MIVVSNETVLVASTDDMRPVKAWCADGMDGRSTATPLWWYPFLQSLPKAQLNDIELMFEGIWWHGLSNKSIFLGIKAPGAKPPSIAAE